MKKFVAGVFVVSSLVFGSYLYFNCKSKKNLSSWKRTLDGIIFALSVKKEFGIKPIIQRNIRKIISKYN